MKQFRAGLVFKAHRLFVSLNYRLESNKEEEEKHFNLRAVSTADSTLVWLRAACSFSFVGVFGSGLTYKKTNPLRTLP